MEGGNLKLKLYLIQKNEKDWIARLDNFYQLLYFVRFKQYFMHILDDTDGEKQFLVTIINEDSVHKRSYLPYNFFLKR